MGIELYLECLGDYLRSYVKRLSSMDLTKENLPRIFEYQGNERHKYPLYFIWMLPEFRGWYQQNGKQQYMVLGKHFTSQMLSLPKYNSQILKDIHKGTMGPRGAADSDVLQAKVSLGWKSTHMEEGSQKSIWSFIARLESVKDELSAAIARSI